jgi:5'-methylthioadenosine phosphorylase
MVEKRARLAVIGGSGLYQMEELSHVEEVLLETPFGPPSDTIVLGTLGGEQVAFLPRHGRGHRILPSELPNLANIYALKLLGVEMVVAVSAVGSLREELAPLHLVVPDQLIDRTQGRPSTFFGQGLVAHIALADPFCPLLRRALVEAARQAGATVHDGGTYVVIEGPAFSTRAESRLYRSWGADIIGMTALPEARLAREAEMCYATLAVVTDYDVWHPHHEDVTAEMILSNLQRGVAMSRQVLRQLIPLLPRERSCPCPNALRDALVTPWQLVPRETVERLRPLIQRYLPPGERG